MNDNAEANQINAEGKRGYITPSIYTNRFTVYGAVEGVKVSFGEVLPSGESAYNSSVIMSYASARQLADLLNKILATESAG